MTDRQTNNPGQYKAVITKSELEKMQGAEEFVVVLKRDDHPITEGTPYNKESVLPDELAESICPEIDDPTPADALRGLNAKALESKEFPGCYYRIVDNVEEWINPPMLAGVEYRTTRRYNGRVVYTKLIPYGSLSTASVDVGSSAIIQMRGMATSTNSYGTLFHDNFPIYAVDGTLLAIAYTQNRSIVVKTYDDAMAAYTAQFVVEYTKS